MSIPPLNQEVVRGKGRRWAIRTARRTLPSSTSVTPSALMISSPSVQCFFGARPPRLNAHVSRSKILSRRMQEEPEAVRNHDSTLAASATRSAGSIRPIAAAALLLRCNSYGPGCCTGISPGFLPLMIWSARRAPMRYCTL